MERRNSVSGAYLIKLLLKVAEDIIQRQQGIVS